MQFAIIRDIWNKILFYQQFLLITILLAYFLSITLAQNWEFLVVPTAIFHENIFYYFPNHFCFIWTSIIHWKDKVVQSKNVKSLLSPFHQLQQSWCTVSWLLSSLLLASGRTQNTGETNLLQNIFPSKIQICLLFTACCLFTRQLLSVCPVVPVDSIMAGFNRNLHFHHRQSSHSTHYTRPWLGRGRVHREGDGWSLVWPQRQGYSRALTSVLTVASLVSTILWLDPTHSLQRRTLVHYISSSSLLTSSEFLLVHEVNKDDFQLMPTNITSDQIMLQM